MHPIFRRTLRTTFNSCAWAGTIFAGLALYSNTETGRRHTLEILLRQNIDDSCIRAGDRQSPASTPERRKPLGPQQQALAKLVAAMDETPVGRVMNESNAARGLLWCAEHDLSRYGSYSSLVETGTLTFALFGGADKVLADDTQFSRALRTMYEESAHAWQNAQQSTHGGRGILIRPAAKTAWTLAAESAARVTAYTALHQHRLAGDRAKWDDNRRAAKNAPIMAAMDEQWRINPDPANPHAQQAGFESFYDMKNLVRAYVSTTQRKPFSRIGFLRPHQQVWHDITRVPTMDKSYLPAAYAPDQPRYLGRPANQENPPQPAFTSS